MVEFKVLETIERPFGYQEKILQYRDSPVKYKAIIKNSALVAILSNRYKLIPNEQVLEIVRNISQARGLDLSYYFYGWRLYCILRDNDIGAMVINSVDGSESLKCQSLFFSEEIPIFPISPNVSLTSLYRKHSKSLEVHDLYDIIPEIISSSREYKNWFEQLSNYKVKDYLEPLKEMIKVLPKKYREGSIEYVYFDPDYSLKDFYETIARRIWNTDNDMKTRINLYRQLNRIIAALGLAILL